MALLPNISKCWVNRCGGASAPSGASRGAKLIPSMWVWGTYSMVSGRSMPASSSTVGRTSMAWVNWRRTSPPAPIRDGQLTMQGSATPPSWTSRFHRLNGVLPAMVQPHG